LNKNYFTIIPGHISMIHWAVTVPRYAELTTEVARAHRWCPCTYSTAMENRLEHAAQFLNILDTMSASTLDTVLYW